MDKELSFRISLQDLFSSAVQKADHHAQHFEHSVSGIGEELAHLREEIGLVVFAFEEFEFLKESAMDFVNLQKTTAQLAFTVGKRGGLAEDMSDLKEESEKLGKSSFFNPREIQAAANQLLNYGVKINQTKESLGALTDVGVAKGKSLSEVISAAGMAAAGGRAMALKEYGLGFLKLEKDMSVAGAEARNFKKIIEAMKTEFSGATADMSGDEFFKIKKIQDELEEFREKIGSELMKAFDALLPYIEEGIAMLKTFGHFIIENAATFKHLAIAITGTFLAFKLIGGAILIIKEITTVINTLKFATQAWADTQITAAEAMSVTPWGAIAAAIALVSFALLEASDNLDEYAKKQEKIKQEKVDSFFEEEKKDVEDMIDSLLKADKTLTEHAARMRILKEENDKYNNSYMVKDDGGLTSQAFLGKTVEEVAGRAKAAKQLLDEMNRAGLRKGDKGDEGLGSGIMEPKASRIQNVTINLNNPFNNQTVKIDSVTDAKDIAPKFLEFLLSLTTDAAIATTE